MIELESPKGVETSAPRIKHDTTPGGKQGEMYQQTANDCQISIEDTVMKVILSATDAEERCTTFYLGRYHI